MYQFNLIHLILCSTTCSSVSSSGMHHNVLLFCERDWFEYLELLRRSNTALWYFPSSTLHWESRATNQSLSMHLLYALTELHSVVLYAGCICQCLGNNCVLIIGYYYYALVIDSLYCQHPFSHHLDQSLNGLLL